MRRNDVGPNEKSLREKVKEQLKSDLEKKFEQEQSKLQGKATEALEKHLQDLTPEISEVVNQVTRDALKQKAQQMGTVKEIAKIGLIATQDVLDGTVVRVPKAYPAYFGAYTQIGQVRDWLQEFDAQKSGKNRNP